MQRIRDQLRGERLSTKMQPELTQMLDMAHKDLDMCTTTVFPGFHIQQKRLSAVKMRQTLRQAKPERMRH